MLKRLAIAALLALGLAGPAQAATTLVSSAARTVSGNSGVLAVPAQPGLINAGIFLLDVTAAATEAGDTLDVYIQSSIDGGTTWDDFVHFTQVIGTGGARKHLAHWTRLVAPTTAMKAPQDAALAVGVQQGPIGPVWRVKWVVVDVVTGGNASFTFSVSLEPALTR